MASEHVDFRMMLLPLQCNGANTHVWDPQMIQNGSHPNHSFKRVQNISWNQQMCGAYFDETWGTLRVGSISHEILTEHHRSIDLLLRNYSQVFPHWSTWFTCQPWLKFYIVVGVIYGSGSKIAQNFACFHLKALSVSFLGTPWLPHDQDLTGFGDPLEVKHRSLENRPFSIDDFPIKTFISSRSCSWRCLPNE